MRSGWHSTCTDNSQTPEEGEGNEGDWDDEDDQGHDADYSHPEDGRGVLRWPVAPVSLPLVAGKVARHPAVLGRSPTWETLHRHTMKFKTLIATRSRWNARAAFAAMGEADLFRHPGARRELRGGRAQRPRCRPAMVFALSGGGHLPRRIVAAHRGAATGRERAFTTAY